MLATKIWPTLFSDPVQSQKPMSPTHVRLQNLNNENCSWSANAHNKSRAIVMVISAVSNMKGSQFDLILTIAPACRAAAHWTERDECSVELQPVGHLVPLCWRMQRLFEKSPPPYSKHQATRHQVARSIWWNTVLRRWPVNAARAIKDEATAFGDFEIDACFVRLVVAKKPC